jgi:hypothetical protein
MQIGPYLPLFDFEVQHTFFPEGRCANALRFVLAPASARLLERSGLVARTTEAGVALFADGSRLEALRLIVQDAEEPLCLIWLAYAADPLFGNYTEGLVYPPEGIPMFDSDDAVAEGQTGRWRLQRAAYVSAADARPLEDETVARALSGKPQRVPPLFVVTLGLGAVRSGSSSDGAAATKAWLPDPKRYVLRFATRTTVWKYWLIGDWAASQPQVVDPDGKASFLQAQEAALPDGRPALTIRSVAPIEIFRRSPFRFQLRAGAGGHERVLVKRLPVADAAQLTREAGAPGGSVVSEIYVHR